MSFLFPGLLWNVGFGLEFCEFYKDSPILNAGI